MKTLKLCQIMDENASEVIKGQTYKLEDIAELVLGANTARLELTLRSGQKICEDYTGMGLLYIKGV